MKNEDIERIQKKIAMIFNKSGLWSCEFCYYIDVSDGVCKICNRLMSILASEVDK